MDNELNRRELELHHIEAALLVDAGRLATTLSERGEKKDFPGKKLDALAARARSARESALRARESANTEYRALLDELEAKLKRAQEEAVPPGLRSANRHGRAKDAAKEFGLAAQVLEALQTGAVAEAPPPAPVKPPPAPKLAAVPTPKDRVSQRVKMVARVDFSSDDNFYCGFSSNISEGGLFVATVNLLPLGTEVDLSFELPSGERIDAKGVVRWLREVNDKLPDAFPGMGVQFIGLDDHAQGSIEGFISRRDPLFFAA